LCWGVCVVLGGGGFGCYGGVEGLGVGGGQ